MNSILFIFENTLNFFLSLNITLYFFGALSIMALFGLIRRMS